MAIRILIVEDEIRLAASLRRGFEENGYTMRHAANAAQCRDMLAKNMFDVLILDLMLEKEDGMDICREIRASGNPIPILILSARDRVEDKVAGLELGADDYLSKPFAFPELMARIRGLVRRKGSGAVMEAGLEYEGVSLDLNHRTAQRDGAALNLTPKEFSLLEYFLRNPGKLINRITLAEKVWDRNFELNTNIIEVYITYLRKKMNVDGKPNLIHAVRSAGYIFEKRP